jgi:hypothetical protein
MKKTLVSFTISFACLIGFCKFVNADTISITTADVGAWQVAKLIQAPVAPGSPKKNRATTDVIFKNYIDGYSTIVNHGETLPTNSILTNPDKTLSKGDILDYSYVKQAYTTKPHPSDFKDILLTTADARTGMRPINNADINSTMHEHNSLESSGYYAFKTDFSLSPETSDLSGLFLNINLDVFFDDTLEGIFLNGYELTKYSSYRALQGSISSPAASIRLIHDINGSILLDDLITQGLFFTDAVNTLEFVVSNAVVTFNGSYNVETELFFGAFGDINIGNQLYENSFASTPEPATLLICLTCGGLALAIRRRKNKKTE